ncbi:MAG: cupin domain-containing protein [Gaiellaceae bacterium]
MTEEARLEQVGNGLAPVTDGWFVVNARDAAWIEHDAFGYRCRFETDGRVASAREGLEPQMFAETGYTLAVLEPGKPTGMYHAEDSQEDFFVVSGECIAIVEEQERRLRQYDFLHCPPGTRHVFVGAGDSPCVLLMVGNRVGHGGIVYPRSEAALAHGAGVDEETNQPREAYAPYGHWQTGGEKPEL